MPVITSTVQNNFSNASSYGPQWFPAWLEALNLNDNIYKIPSTAQFLQMFAEFTDVYGETYGVSYDNFTTKYDTFVQRCMYEEEPCATK